MAELEEKLNSLLSDPEAMAQIMQMAQALGAGRSESAQARAQHTPPPKEASPGPAPAGLSSLLGNVDPGTILRFLPLIQELGAGNSNARQLLYALRPYLKEERQEKVERALQLARLFHVGKRFLTEWRGGHV